MNELTKKLILLSQQGPLPFDVVMAAALYDPVSGYYQKIRETPDYYTSVDVHEFFAVALARWLARQSEALLGEQKITWVELGSGTGKLAGQILQHLAHDFPQLYGRLTYYGFERGVLRRESARGLQSRFPGKYFACEHFEDLPEFNGLVFSNEFFDALPFRRVQMQGGKLAEFFWQDGREVLLPAALECEKYFEWLGVFPLDNAWAEAGLEVLTWMEKIRRKLKSGGILTIDYGMKSEELLNEVRPQGTALCFYKNQADRSFYENLGDKDITAHVNFSAMMRRGDELGLKTVFLKSQGQVLAETSLEFLIAETQKITDARAQVKAKAALQSLIHPEGMGGTFRWLWQTTL